MKIKEYKSYEEKDQDKFEEEKTKLFLEGINQELEEERKEDNRKIEINIEKHIKILDDSLQAIYKNDATGYYQTMTTRTTLVYLMHLVKYLLEKGDDKN